MENLDARFCDLMEEFNKRHIEMRKAEIKRRKLKVMEQISEREQREKDDLIMIVDTSEVDDQGKAYYELRKNEIYAKQPQLLMIIMFLFLLYNCVHFMYL